MSDTEGIQESEFQVERVTELGSRMSSPGIFWIDGMAFSYLPHLYSIALITSELEGVGGASGTRPRGAGSPRGCCPFPRGGSGD
jgi:hypothetical protein